MYDSWGDGWDAGSYSVSLDGAEVASGTLLGGSEGSDELCLVTGCYDVTVGGSDYEDEMSFDFGSLVGALAGTYTNIAIGDISCAVQGCMDPDATNYNADATEDNGSCEYSCEYYGQTTVSCDGGDYQYEVAWTITDCSGAELMVGGAPFSECSDLDFSAGYVVNMTDSWGDGWNGNVLSVGAETYTICLLYTSPSPRDRG